MKLECAADKRTWAVVKDAWTRNDLRRFEELFATASIPLPPAPADGQAEAKDMAELRADVASAHDGLREYYKSVVSDAAVVDANGKEFRGVAEVFDSVDLGDLDAAVEAFWVVLPRRAYRERASLGEARRAG